MDQPTAILKKTENYLHKKFKENDSSSLNYHNWSHTQSIVSIAKELCNEAGLTINECEQVLLAAWFVNSGYLYDYENFISHSIKEARDFLSQNDFNKERANQIVDLIEGSGEAGAKRSKLHEILHDAIISDIGKKRFFRRSELLRIERKQVLDEEYTEQDWEQRRYDYLVETNFLTKEAKSLYGSRRSKNIKRQRKNIITAQKITTRTNTGKDLGRGIDTLYRSSYRTHINLSAIADGKANMMISINTILISVIVTLSGASLSIRESYIIENLRFTVPIFTLLISSLLSVVFAVLSARPKLTQKDIDWDKLNNNDMSLLYFGNFLGVTKKQFKSYLQRLKENQEDLYDSMSMDLYNLGKVLKEKYRLLKISYNVFMIGLSLTVVAFILIFIYTNS
ncbi:Pycsar system effector family protein [Fulvivirga lutea]|uniref:Pycsar effector protein domain-containing protein n=1 Tax=Fulvivirga lutea TaxID=2810512 RepID=A0A974WJL9_9BACT|nr:Pycsar system effector family protein [Fulvivirga lutea]QSE97370.1 hypothetical protein JR347_17580 [Fulvivirga lutea]